MLFAWIYSVIAAFEAMRLSCMLTWEGHKRKKHTSCMLLVVVEIQSRRHGGALVGLDPPNKAPNPPNWNVKHYKYIEFWLIL